MKKLLSVLLVLVMCFSLFASGSSEAKASENKTVTLEWWTWDPEMIEQNRSIIAAFEAQNPGIKINNTIVDTQEYWTKLRIQAQQKRLPDVFTLSSGYIEEWAEEGLLRNLDDLIAADKGFFDEFYKPIFDVTKGIANQDHYYAVPFALVNTVLYFNKDMFDAAGIPYPTDDWTWEEFREAAKKLTIDKNGDGTPDQWGYWFYGRYAHAESWIFANDGYLVNRDTMRFEPDANAMEALKMLTDLVLVDHSAPRQKDMSALKNQQVFPNELCAMWVDGGWYVDDFRKIGDKFQWGFVRVPQGPSATKRLTYAWPDSYALSPYTENADAAWKFVKFIAGQGISLDQFMAGKIPAYKGLTESDAFVDLTVQPGENMQLLRDMANDEMTTSYTKGWNEWRGYGAADTMGLNGVIDSIINGETSFDAGMKSATESINKVLARYYK